MLPELGQFALVLALLVAALQTVLPLAGAQRGIAAWTSVARPAAFAQFALVAFAFGVLTYGFVSQDFSIKYVATNSNSLLPSAPPRTTNFSFPLAKAAATLGAATGSAA